MSPFGFALLSTTISASGVAGAQTTTTGYHQFNLSRRFICFGAHQSDVLENPWGIAFLPGQHFFLAEDHVGRVDSDDATGQLVSGFNIPLAVRGTGAFAGRLYDSDQA